MFLFDGYGMKKKDHAEDAEVKFDMIPPTPSLMAAAGAEVRTPLHMDRAKATPPPIGFF